MNRQLFSDFLSQRYALEVDLANADDVVSGKLCPHDGNECVPVIDSIPRFVEGQGYAGNFGLQWNTFRATQLDSATGLPLTFNRFWNNTKWLPKDVVGKTVLEAGSGAGRFTEVLLNAGARVVSFDLTNAVDANWASNRGKGELLLYQGDICDIPFPDDYFDYVFCYGVLQHTPDPAASYKSLFAKLRPGGRISVDLYRRFAWPNVWATPKYLWRPVTSRMDPEKLLRIIRAYIPIWLPIDSIIRRIPFVGPRLLAVIPIPCWNYLFLGLSRAQRKEWAIMDTFDALAARYDYPQSKDDVEKMIASPENAESEIFFGSNGLVANVIKRNAVREG